MKKIKYVLWVIIFTTIILISILVLNTLLKKNYFAPSVGQPYNWRWGNVTDSTTSIFFNVDVYNPNIVKITLRKEAVEGFIKFDGKKIGNISLRKNFTINKRSLTPLELEAKIDNSALPECLYLHFKNNEKSVINFSISFNFHVRKANFSIPLLNNSIPLNTSILKNLDENLTEFIRHCLLIKNISVNSMLQDIEEDRIVISHKINIRSRFLPVPLPAFEYKIFGNNLLLGKGKKSGFNIILPIVNKTVLMETELENQIVDDLWVSHFNNSKRTNLKINITLKFLWFKKEETILSKNISYDPIDWIEKLTFEIPTKRNKSVSPTFYDIARYLFIEIILIAIIMGVVVHYRKRKSQ